MGHRSWMTTIENKQAWDDFYEAFDQSYDLDHNFILKVEVEKEGFFKKGTLIIAWSGDGNHSLSRFPDYLDKKTELLDNFVYLNPDWVPKYSYWEKHGTLYRNRNEVSWKLLMPKK